MTSASITLDYLRLLLPHTTGLIVLFVFRIPLLNFLKRITNLEFAGAKLEANPQKNQELVAKKASLIEQTLGLFKEETVNLYKNSVLTETGFNQLEDENQKAERLLDYATALYLIKDFEQIFNLIFGSQIKLLQRLNVNYSGESEDTLLPFYENAQKFYPEFYDGISYKDFLQFLYDSSLIIKQNEILGITILGRDFLKYLIEKGKDLNKPY